MNAEASMSDYFVRKQKLFGNFNELVDRYENKTQSLLPNYVFLNNSMYSF